MKNTTMPPKMPAEMPKFDFPLDPHRQALLAAMPIEDKLMVRRLERHKNIANVAGVSVEAAILAGINNTLATVSNVLESGFNP